MNLVVAEIAGKQYLVQEGDTIKTPKLKGKVGDTVQLSQVLLFWDGKSLSLGQPYLEGFSIEGTILEEGRAPKVIAYKYKRRKDSHRKVGHRQDFFAVKIEKITHSPKAKKEVSGKKASPSAAAKPKVKKAEIAKKKTTGKKVVTKGRRKPVSSRETTGKPKPTPRKRTGKKSKK